MYVCIPFILLFFIIFLQVIYLFNMQLDTYIFFFIYAFLVNELIKPQGFPPEYHCNLSDYGIVSSSVPGSDQEVVKELIEEEDVQVRVKLLFLPFSCCFYLK